MSWHKVTCGTLNLTCAIGLKVLHGTEALQANLPVDELRRTRGFAGSGLSVEAALPALNARVQGSLARAERPALVGDT